MKRFIRIEPQLKSWDNMSFNISFHDNEPDIRFETMKDVVIIDSLLNKLFNDGKWRPIP